MGKDTGEKRETWNRKIDFLIACVGFSVGLGNVWRFPYMCYKNGGGAFLIPYCICAVIGGIPLFYLEVAVGQFMSVGGVYAWKICPILQGIGWTTASIVFFLNCYYNVILAWAFYYMFASFTSVLPWDSCDNYWNTDRCITFSDYNASSSKYINNTISNVSLVDSTTEFWERKVLNITDGIEDIGSIKWDLALTLVFAWCLVYICIWQGIKTSGKVMYVTATSPYLFMLILLIRMALLPGSMDGVLYYVVPDFSKLTEMQVWIDAGNQIFFSYSIALGALTSLGSYNDFHHNSYRDSILFALINSGTSIFAGFLIFSILGFMANEQGVSIDQVAEGGPGLAFIAYPKAVSQMPIAPLWSCLFFLMIILLGLDSQFVDVEGLVIAIVDTFPILKKRKQLFVAFLCLLQCLVGLAMVTEGGMYVFQLFDYYSGARILLLVSFFMCIVVITYGVNRFYDNIEMMYGFRISPYMKVCWMFFSPLFCITFFIMGTIDYSELTYSRPSAGEYIYPSWAVGIGWGLSAISCLGIPCTAVYNIIKYRREGKPWVALLRPEQLKPHQLRPQDMHELPPDYTENGYIVEQKELQGAPTYRNTAAAAYNNTGFEPPLYADKNAPIDYDNPKITDVTTL